MNRPRRTPGSIRPGRRSKRSDVREGENGLTRVLPLVAALILVALSPADAGHELPFYPSFYPQEITVTRLDRAAAADRLAEGDLHAYVGADPFATPSDGGTAGGTAPAHVTRVTSLGGLIVATLNRELLTDHTSRCAAAAKLRTTLSAKSGDWVFHPYPITPYHADYLAHHDRAQAARAPAPNATGGALRMRARGDIAEKLVATEQVKGDTEWDAMVEVVDLERALGHERTALDGWLGPPWRKAGWSHAHAVLAAGVTDPAARHVIRATYARLVGGHVTRTVERLNLERKLVASLLESCERIVLGYTLRREAVNTEYSKGVENLARDSHEGLAAAIFLRAVKLKDFPWNGWLHLAVEDAATAAWNPIAGFTDRMGRLVWSAVGDPALLPSPHGASWMANRATGTVSASSTGVAVPADALTPTFSKIGPGKRAAARIEYRVRASAFHDGTRMTVADALYPIALVPRTRSGPEIDPTVAAWSALLRERLVAVRPVRVETIVREFSDVKFVYDVPVIEVYLDRPGPADESLAIAPPWSAVPWPVLALMDEARHRGLGAFSEAAASARGVPWLDLVRDPKQITVLTALAEELRARNHIPAPLKALVTADEARRRWAALTTFAGTHHHFLVTNGPYQLTRWGADGAVLQVFRDLTYPIGVGSFDEHAIPLRAWITKVDDRGDRLELRGDVERVSKFGREYELVREPIATPRGSLDAHHLPECRYVVLDARGHVVLAGTVPYRDPVGFTVRLGSLTRGRYTVKLALSALGNAVDPPITTIEHVVR